MPMVPFYTRFRELAFAEMRNIVAIEPGPGLPAGEYGFLELFCDEPGCDCRRAHIQVVSGPPKLHTYANINFAWETREFYAKWSRARDPECGPGAFLDPLNYQSEAAPELLDLFDEFCASDPAWVRRLAKHYELFKAEVEREARESPAAPAEGKFRAFDRRKGRGRRAAAR
jgi:hypothetical protein